MKRMKKLSAIAGLAALCVILAACADSSSGGGGSTAETVINYSAAGSASVPTIAKDTIVRNKVVNLNGSTDVYYEYLKFTSEEAGEYKLYKYNGLDENGVEKEKTEVTTLTGYTIPDAFTYDKTTGKVSTTKSAASVSSVYFLESGADKVVAKEIMTTTATTKALLDTEWKNAASETFKFDNFGAVYVKTSSGEFGYTYTNNSGWITVGSSIPFLWATVGTDSNLYYQTYKTDRTTATDYGRSVSVSSETYDFVSSDFLFLK